MKVNEGVVLGIDPGLISCGFSVIRKNGNNIFLLDYGILKLSSADSIQYRLSKFYHMLLEKISLFQVNFISIETPFLGKNASTFLKLGYMRGILYLVAELYNLKMFEFTPCQIKTALTGFGFADKEQVSRLLLKLFPNIKIVKFDATDALAVSVCCIMSHL